MNVVQIVKNYGPIGGMEEYVFRLCMELAAKGTEVTVLCQANHVKAPGNVEVVELGIHRKPHWVSHFRFSSKVNNWLRNHPSKKRIVHSHERQNSHQLTTFHTTPFGTGKRRKFLHWLSPRHQLFEYLERRELAGQKVQAVVPVSTQLGEAIHRKYPAIDIPIKNPIYPGVSMEPADPDNRKPPPKDGGTIGFMGREWKRKGLSRVIKIWKYLKCTRPKLKLKIAGVHSVELSGTHLLGEKGLQVLGWTEDKEQFYKEIDLLIHPAKREAFGMVIAEALTACVPVLCSTECGASEIVSSDQGRCIPVDASTEIWRSAASEILDKSPCKSSYNRSWSIVANEYQELYAEISKC
ncbi:MAG: glycosyltransferase family 4 protein [Opitutae bacterium]|jgi:UDP-glucose:(heptosyl)LPS alpha-1,3-glucosyltransferase|nr:glycosyltransferase family 4 protein [Opitutae bacterium]MBT5692614.1 glycosyltransferase family 4 protein [Opitutae bacterium]MBT6463972.1 glycosyltransferase family 4 protein [Opitutae bacterium]MBT6959327.1 glycosyltransferase family 4 protein [Opitutae bacterium]MBT7854336.1 glycosyltransferase family 4 protein [Opitutae bacterium]